MMADHPVYHINWGSTAIVVDGKQAVIDFYRSGATDVVMYHTDNLLAVARIGGSLTNSHFTTLGRGRRWRTSVTNSRPAEVLRPLFAAGIPVAIR